MQTREVIQKLSKAEIRSLWWCASGVTMQPSCCTV